MKCYCCGAELDEAGTHLALEEEAAEIFRCHANPFIRVLPKKKVKNGKQAKNSS